MGNTQKFDGRAGAYSAGRPAYAEDLIETLYTEFGLSASSIIADIGSGTGIFTEQLLKRGSTVYAVEPNDGMRSSAEARLSTFCNFHSVNGTAECTGLQKNCVDFITVAQAFHWFDAVTFKRECGRILKENGKIFLIWNTRVADAGVNLLQQVAFARFCPNFKGFSGGMQRDDERIKLFFDGKFGYREYANHLCYDREKYIQRCLSSSYSLKDGDKKYDEYLQTLYGIFDEFAIDGTLTIPNVTQVYFTI